MYIKHGIPESSVCVSSNRIWQPSAGHYFFWDVSPMASPTFYNLIYDWYGEGCYLSIASSFIGKHYKQQPLWARILAAFYFIFHRSIHRTCSCWAVKSPYVIIFYRLLCSYAGSFTASTANLQDSAHFLTLSATTHLLDYWVFAQSHSP